ncbi:MAG: DNA cytosine methyltransferase [Bacteroidales bacterium]|nr:DNA cytosine methyltransferase [Lachnoclostridium sp.]MCM1384432.1 DNA cytosine methyltransferase [Lachnoclostridium sp.]MCM1465212.1 DNA cytosine methyltransferase [Bacteroidales bacterium]
MAYAIDLFCGAGGMSEGLIQAGFHILFSSDINSDVQRTYMNRHEQLGLHQGVNTHFHRGDIRELNGDMICGAIQNLEIFRGQDIPEIDAIFGGPPCQGFSRAGRRDPNDPRNMLFREYLRVINEVRPKYVVLENVTGFTDTRFYGFVGVTGYQYKDGELVPNILRNEFRLIGYQMLEPRILNAAHYGVPQRRNRIIVMAYRNDVAAPAYPEPTHNDETALTITDAISDLIRDEKVRNQVHANSTEFQERSREGRTPNIDGKTIHSDGAIHNNEASTHQQIISERFALFKEGEDGAELKNRIMSEGIDIADSPALIAHCAEKMGIAGEEVIALFKNGNVSRKNVDILLTRKNIRTRLDRTKPSATVMTIADDYISPFEPRTFTVRELARMQSFDDSFEFLGKRTTGGLRRRVEVPQYSQVGNAVPPLLAKAVASEIIRML